MKNLNAKTMIVLFMSIMVGLSANALTDKDSVAAKKSLKVRLSEQTKNKKEKKQATCLRVIGSALDENGFPISGIEVTLLKDNEELLRQQITHQKTAENLVFFGLTRNSHYSIVISKEGYVSRLINISTTLPDNVKTWKNVFVFEFEAMLYATNDTDDTDYLDFPIAIISYDPASGGFVNHDQYTQHIKKKIQSSGTEMATTE